MRKSWIAIGFAIVLTVSALTALIGYQLLESPEKNMAQPWMFKGAYATYYGQIDSLSAPYSLCEEIQVIELNSSHVQIRTDSKIATSFAPTFSDQTILWVSKSGINFQPKGETLAKCYRTQITVKNIGPRNCIVFDYINEAINATYYIDKILLWPVRIVYETTFDNQTYKIDFTLQETNIVGLS